jgi:hypothetical protein
MVGEAMSAKRLLLAGALLLPAGLLLLFGVSNQPSRAEPNTILEVALSGYAKGDFDPFVGKPFGRPLMDMRGLLEADAKELLRDCAKPDAWTYVGDEWISGSERGDFPNAIMRCQLESDSLLVRLWTERWKVDHLIELAYRSEFVACRQELCPDFSVGEPQDPHCSSCEPRFKIQRLANSK